MELKFYCPHWGSKHLPFRDFSKKVKESGYDGVEMGLPLNKPEKKEILSALQDYDLKLLGQHWETNESDFNKYKSDYQKRIENLLESNPVLINSQTGKDYFAQEQNLELIDLAGRLSKNTQTKIVHETHRGKFSFACHITGNYLQAKSTLELCLDVSHWFNVAESDLQDQENNLQLAIERTGHLHARVGHTQSAQVVHPGLPEYQSFLDLHLSIWEKVIAHNKNKGKKRFTITPEFGPYPYMVMVPFTNQPLASQWELNLYMKSLLQERYGNEI